MDLHGCYPVLCCTDVARATAFWTRWFGFSTTFAADWYVSLRREPGGQELALLDHTHPTLPEAFRGRVAAGVLVNLEVGDVDAEWARLTVEGGPEVALALRTEDFGQRHFIVVAPDGVLVDVIAETDPSPEYAVLFTGSASR